MSSTVISGLDFLKFFDSLLIGMSQLEFDQV